MGKTKYQTSWQTSYPWVILGISSYLCQTDTNISAGVAQLKQQKRLEYTDLSMRPARSHSCRQARRQTNLPARLIAQAA